MTDLQIVYVVVFAVMSIVGFLSMYVDKTKAKRRKWRTPEWVLFLIAVLFGGGGHAQAAGCTIHAPLQEALDQMLAAMKDKLDKTPRPEKRA